MSSQPWQLGMSADGDLVAIPRYAVDRCGCGHAWSEHWQPRRGGKASCWARTSGILCECRDFELSTREKAGI